MTKRTSAQAAGSSTGSEKKADDVLMDNGMATGDAGEGGEIFSNAKTSQDEDDTVAPNDNEQPAGSNKRKRDFKAERQAKRQKKEAIKAPKRAAGIIREAEEAIERQKKAAEKAVERAEARRVRDEQMAVLQEQKREEKAKKYEENLRQQQEDKLRRAEEKKRDIEAKRKDAEEKRKDRERIQALEKQVRDLKRGHGNNNKKGKVAKKVGDKAPKGPKTSEFFGEGLKAQVIGLSNESKGEAAGLGEEAAKESSKKLKTKRSWKDLKEGKVAPIGLEAKIAAARVSLAHAEGKVDDDVPMEDAPEEDDAEEENEAEKETSKAAATETDAVSDPVIEQLVEDSPESIAESEAPAQIEDQEIDSEVPEETSEENVEEAKVDEEEVEEEKIEENEVGSEISGEESKDQEEEVLSAEESSPVAQEEDKTEEEDAAPVADAESELDESKEEVEISASAKKRSRRRVRNNNRLETEGTPIKPTTPITTKGPKVKTPSATPLAYKNQKFKAPLKSPALTKAATAKKGKAPAKTANKDQAAPKSPGAASGTKAKRVRVPKAVAAVLATTTGLDSPARTTRSSAKAHHSDDMIEAMDDGLEGICNTPGNNDDDDIYESITCVSRSNSVSEFQTPSNTLKSFNNMELPILRNTDNPNLSANESDSSKLSELSITDHPFLASDSSAADMIEVDVPSLLRSGRKQRPPAHSPYFTQSPAPTPSKSKNHIAIQEASMQNSSPKKGTPKKRPAGTISCIPFPPLSAPHFGIIQEKLAHDPFRLLIAVTFLNRTHGKHAIPVFYTLMEHYPTPKSLVDASKEDIVSVIRHLGLQNQRAATYQAYAKIFCENPPVKYKRYAVHDYPIQGLGRDVKKSEVLPEESEEDPRTAWEIGHMTQGPYALDSWRIFCRDILLGKAQGWNGEGNGEEGFQPEWMRVVPEDKELRAFLRWMWLKEGFAWDPFTGEKEVAGEVLMRAAMEGRIAWDEGGGMRVLGVDVVG
ncbi:hypothetical protein SBOR_3309 [Sclerotinia borealis F-4128]|uniref:HhH-GPD domain-containing protein n=1 Tax=Sclerotinia borealis (strain F-4128) TaxID=1432307 RepID=W9CNN5_SCLBF|nr:hypothetical protein SBOR_3309 [Sclerotinia borealis F-4128]